MTSNLWIMSIVIVLFLIGIVVELDALRKAFQESKQNTLSGDPDGISYGAKFDELNGIADAISNDLRSLLIAETFNLYQNLVGQLRRLAAITEETATTTNDSLGQADIITTFDEVRNQLMRLLETMRSHRSYADALLKQRESLGESKWLFLVGGRAGYVSRADTIDRLSRAESAEIDALRERAKQGVAVLEKKANMQKTESGNNNIGWS